MKSNQDRLKSISYYFPTDPQSKRITGILNEMLLKCGGRLDDNSIVFKPIFDNNALPYTKFSGAETVQPYVSLDTSENINLDAGNFKLVSQNQTPLSHSQKPSRLANKKRETLTDKKGKFFKKEIYGNDYFVLDFGDLYKRLESHITGLDHTGFIAPSSMVSQKEWENVKYQLANISNLYDYPDDPLMPFLLPSTSSEFNKEISNFVPNRKPKFEFRYNLFKSIPVIDIDFNTDLTKPEIEELFPPPYGFDLPGLEDYMRLVDVDSPWENIALGIAIRVNYEKQDGIWNTGKFMVDQGTRVTKPFRKKVI